MMYIRVYINVHPKWVHIVLLTYIICTFHASFIMVTKQELGFFFFSIALFLTNSNKPSSKLVTRIGMS